MLIWNNNFIKPFETYAGIAAKVCFLNICNLRLLNIKVPSLYLDAVERFIDPYKNLESILGKEGEEIIKNYTNQIFGLFNVHIEHNIQHLLRKEFTICPKCIYFGYHSIIHQLSFMDECCIHKIPLLRECPKCHSANFEWTIDRTSRAYICKVCGRPFVRNPIEKFIKSMYESPISSLSDITRNESKYQNAVILSIPINLNDIGHPFAPPLYKEFLNRYIFNDIITGNPDIHIKKKRTKREKVKYCADFLLLAQHYDKVFHDLESYVLSEINISQTAYDEVLEFIKSIIDNGKYDEKLFCIISKDALIYFLFYELLGNNEIIKKARIVNFLKHDSRYIVFTNTILLEIYPIYEALSQDLLWSLDLSIDQMFRIADDLLFIILKDIYIKIRDCIRSANTIESTGILSKSNWKLNPPGAIYYSYKLIIFEAMEDVSIYIFRK